MRKDYFGLNPRWLLASAALLLVSWLSYAPFWNPDEGRYAAASLEMIGGLQNRVEDWILPHLNTVPRLAKPPLVYWVGGGLFKLLGVSEFAGRLGPALASVVVLFAVWSLGRSMFNERTGILAALVWATSLLPAALGRTLNTDMLLTATMTLIFWGLWNIANADEKTEPRKKLLPYVITGIGMGLGMLAKGPVSIVLPFLSCFLFFTIRKKWKHVQWPGTLLAVGLAFAIAAPWFYAVDLREPGFVYRFIIAENIGRFSGAEYFHKPTPIWYYLPVAILGLLPWMPLAAMALFKSGDNDDANNNGRLFVWLWAILIIAFFSKSSVKLISYILPAFPALALIAADGILRGGNSARRLGAALTVLVNVVAMGAIIWFLFSGHTIPHEVGTGYWLPCAILGVFSFVVARALLQGHNLNAGILQYAGASFLMFFLLHFAGTLSKFEDSSAMFRLLHRHMKETDIIAQIGSFEPTAIFYARRPVYVPNFVNTSSLSKTATESSPYFPKTKPNDISWLLEKKERVFIIIRSRRVKIAMPRNAYVWASNNEYKLVSNQPAPAEWQQDFAALMGQARQPEK